MSKPKSQQARFDMRISHEFARMIEDWRRRQYPDIPSKTQAIEFLCRAAIAANAKYKPENLHEASDEDALG